MPACRAACAVAVAVAVAVATGLHGTSFSYDEQDCGRTVFEYDCKRMRGYYGTVVSDGGHDVWRVEDVVSELVEAGESGEI